MLKLITANMALPIKKEGIIGTEKPTFSNEFVGFSVYFFGSIINVGVDKNYFNIFIIFYKINTLIEIPDIM